MDKITQKDVEKLVNETKEKYGKDLHFIMLAYKSEDGKQIKFTQHIETNAPDIIISFLERIKIMLVNSLNELAKKKLKIKKTKR